MVCIYCKAKTEITNTRHLARNNTTWRRRHCLKCGALITTTEAADYGRSWVVSDEHSSRLSPFSRDKLFLSVYDSLKHRKTAVSDAGALTSTIISTLAKTCPDGQIAKQRLTATVIDCLKRFDKTSSVHYQAYYANNT